MSLPLARSAFLINLLKVNMLDKNHQMWCHVLHAQWHMCNINPELHSVFLVRQSTKFKRSNCGVWLYCGNT